MRPFFRAEALAQLSRWRELATGLGVMLAGLWLATWPGLFYTALGLLLAVLGAALAWLALRRARFHVQGSAAGLVEIVEGQIAYLAPGGGGFAALSEISEIALGSDKAGEAVWLIAQPGQPILAIPASAKGAGALYDAFASLPGARPGLFLAALSQPAPKGTPRPLWRRHAHPALH